MDDGAGAQQQEVGDWRGKRAINSTTNIYSKMYTHVMVHRRISGLVHVL